MATSKTTIVDLVECAISGDAFMLDAVEAANITENRIKGVKILGLSSLNGRDYSEAALEKAAPLYEGIKVNANHPKKPGDPRNVEDRLGMFENVKYVKGKGLYGDLVMNPHHPIAESVKWFAGNMPNAIGPSHNAQGKARKGAKGKEIVEEIITVRSVDIVADPATTKGLLEHVENLRSSESRDVPESADRRTKGGSGMELEKATLDMLRSERPDLLEQHEKSRAGAAQLTTLSEENKRLKAQVDEAATRNLLEQKQSNVAKAIKGSGLPEDAVSDDFIEQCLGTKDDAQLKKVIDDRVSLVESIGGRKLNHPSGKNPPRAREQQLSESTGRSGGKQRSGKSGGNDGLTLASFVEGVRRGIDGDD